MGAVLHHSEKVYEQSRRIETSQLELQEDQLKLRRSWEEGMEMLHNSYKNLGQGMDGLRDEAIDIKKEITKVGDAIKVQSEALEESRSKLQQLAEYGHRQQEELLQRQKHLQQFHDHLMENSQSILAAQLEVLDIEQQTWIVNLVRTVFLLLAFLQLLHAICTYRDYDVLNHHMLLMLVEKINGMQTSNKLTWDSESDMSWASWIDTELSKDIEDSEYDLPEEIGENSISTTSTSRKYNIRHRSLR
ncbi:protein GAMETE EXPRESSED 1-like [Cucumis melo var. makuwa]|uniref:Protein GAMETE EXPRESSED 1-like n=1 Tax=Cucumis melo var. makuwa TaxID=1194695 RepID=A0A5D3CS22_CUCMM|nr:protein GAMETE EXPRESSED 1-like [Cucumis melo var. makuwa]